MAFNPNQIVKGDSLLIFAQSGLKSLGMATSSTLTINLSTTEINCAEAGNFTANIANKLSWSMSSENLYVQENYDRLNDAFNNRSLVSVCFGTPYLSEQEKKEGYNTRPTFDHDYNYLSGYGYISSLNLTASSGDAATFSIEITGSGALTLHAPTPVPTTTTEP